VGRWVLGRIAEAVAEQRLLWHLRHVTHGRLVHPDDIMGERAVTVLRDHLQADYSKHVRWCGIDALLTAILGPLLFFVPGPNVVSWFFAFRAVGHFLALRGARQGLNGVRWETVPSVDLRAIREALGLPAADRRALLDRLSSALGLAHLGRFVERLSGGHS
jgi:hypothetical protein